MYDFLQYQKEVAPWQPKQGYSETRFHNGFQRRQQPDIRQDEGRLAHVAAREKRARRAEMPEEGVGGAAPSSAGPLDGTEPTASHPMATMALASG